MEEVVKQNKAQETSASNNVEGMLSLRETLDIFLYNWKWFLLSVIVCLVLARIYLATQSPIFQRQAVMLVKDDSGNGGRRSAIGNEALMQLNGVMMGSSVRNEIYILRSHQLLKEVARKLHLDVTYTLKSSIFKGRLRTVSLYDTKPFEIQFLEEDPEYVAVFKVRVLNNNECRLSDFQVGRDKFDYNKTVRFGQMVETPAGKLTVIPNPKYTEPYQGKDITIAHLDLDRAANMIANRVATGEVDRESSLVRLICTDTNIQRADDILAGLLDAYKQSIIDDKNKVAQSTADFIDSRIELIKGELSDVEGSMAAFKQRHNLVDLSQNAQAYLTQSSSARQRTIQLQAQQATINYLLENLKDKSRGNSLIPTLGDRRRRNEPDCQVQRDDAPTQPSGRKLR